MDFIVRTDLQEEEVKMVFHVYWSQEKVYIMSEYRLGEAINIVILENGQRILEDSRFYITGGFKFTAKKGRDYSIRFSDTGSISKLVSMEMSKTVTGQKFDNLASEDDMSKLSARLSNLKEEMMVHWISILDGGNYLRIRYFPSRARSGQAQPQHLSLHDISDGGGGCHFDNCRGASQVYDEFAHPWQHSVIVCTLLTRYA